MKLKFLLFALLLSVGVFAQDTIKTFIITEARLDRTDGAYIELTNVGTTPVQMADFEFGRVDAWAVPWTVPVSQRMMLPDKILQPGESFTIAAAYDFIDKAHKVDPDNFGRNLTKAEWWTLADLLLHLPDSKTSLHPEIKDSISEIYSVMENWGGRDAWYLEQHLSDVDSIVVDQVGGVFDEEGGTNYDRSYDVAGVTGATNNSILIRKYVVKTGNTNFAEARGVGLDDSEWMPIPLSYANYDLERTNFWTVGNHGDYNLDENTLVSDKAEVNWANKTITVPWGTKNQDDIMNVFVKKPGIAWHYHLSPSRLDSAYKSVRTGDKLTVYVAGKDLDVQTFDLVTALPTADANIVLPMFRTGDNGYFTQYLNAGRGEEAYWVTENSPGMDTITYDFYGIGFATPVDSLTKYLEKAPKAKWEFVWVDGVKRTAVKNGDKLKVTAENGAVKEYFIKVNGYRPNHNAYLSSITWPDIPEQYKGIFGWIGDTIPNFGSTSYNYVVQVPADVDGIPALIAKTEALNTKVVVKRATTLDGTTEQKTVTFTVTAEDGFTTNVYSVQLEKEKNTEDIQPYVAEPFLSELVFRDNYSNNFWEICNPGNQPLDLSNYMFYWGGSSDPAAAITGSSGVNDWANRYNKYVPGHKWLNELSWAVNPGILEQDLNVNPIVFPGDVFVMADIVNTSLSGYPWWASEQSDIIFRTAYNPWGETSNKGAIWFNNSFFMFKILNDSVKMGLKPANDLNDFELLESWSSGDGTQWNVGGVNVNQVENYRRKPEFHTPVPLAKGSFGTNADNSQWLKRTQAYWQSIGTGWPAWRLNVTLDLGKHFMNEVTSYKSTVASVVYKVSKGYSNNESIMGVKTGTTVSDFMSGIVKTNDSQILKVKPYGGGGDLALNAVLGLNDTLVVLAADSTNTTKYILNVSDEGLSSNAVLTSTRYQISVVTQPKSAGNENAGTGTIKGFDYGTTVRTILANITVPPGATLSVINGEGAYVALKTLNFDTAYVNVTVNDNIYFDVVAENGITEIVYQLMPTSTENDAFALSDIYSVKQNILLIDYVPRGTAVSSLLSNIVGSAGASLKVVDKMGHQRIEGTINDDDKVVVTSANGSVSKAYYLSMLAEEYIPATTYLAYILSNIYGVDQVAFRVAGVAGSESISAFLGKVTAAPGATAMVVDKDSAVKTTGNIDGSDMVKVVSADGKMNVYYTFGPLTSADVLQANDIQLYPNPTNGEINVSGLKAGYRIQVYNSVGAAVNDINVQNSIERISLRNQPSGMYMVVVGVNNKILVRFKALKK